MSIEDLRAAWPQWQIGRREDEQNGGFAYVAQPLDEVKKPPVFEQPQLAQGLRNRVAEVDLGALERQIGLQHKLREQLANEGQTPFDGRTYIEVERVRDGISLA